MQRRLLVTGFGPFPGVPENPSGAAARALNGATLSSKSQSFRVVGVELPTEWAEAWPRLAAAVGACAPHALIMLGVSRRAGIEVERIARNHRSARPDAAGTVADASTVLDPFGPAELHSTLPWAAFERPAEVSGEAIGGEVSGEARMGTVEGFGIGTSTDAGDYLCNFIFYKALRHLPGIGPRGFVHLPPTPGPAAGMAAVRAVVAALD